MAFLVLAFFTLVGLGLVVTGWLGRRVGDHPHCRRCGHDLTGHDARPDACPECGRSLRRRRAVRRGERRRRPWLALGGLALSAVCVGGAAASLRVVDVTPWKPLWLLRLQMHDMNAARADRSVREITRRLHVGLLSDRQVRGLAEEGLRRHADASGERRTLWDDSIVIAWERGVLEDQTLVGHLRRTMTPGITIGYHWLRVRVRRGQWCDLDVRAGARPVSRFESVWSAVAVTRPDGSSAGEFVGGTDDPVTMADRKPPESRVRIDLEPGTHRLVFHTRWHVAARYPSSDEDRDYGPVRDRALVSWVTTDEATIDVLRADVECVAVERPELTALIRRCVGGIACDVQQWRRAAWVRTRAWCVEDLPVDLAFQVVWRDGEREWPVGALVSRRHEGLASDLLTDYLEDVHGPGVIWDLPLTLPRVDVVLRSDPGLVEQHAWASEIWGGEIVFEGVRLRRDVEGRW